ncbi:hypothetical protein BJ742DRAFT_814746 [Cladochytrium replicatum]|nr:hypothetical protein BJ742DRAFT_814746 [Cladochytrium replicatum]
MGANTPSPCAFVLRRRTTLQCQTMLISPVRAALKSGSWTLGVTSRFFASNASPSIPTDSSSSHLRLMFDSPTHWHNTRMSRPSAVRPTGLFGYNDLVSPKALYTAAQIRLRQAQALVDAIIDEKSNSTEEIRRTVKRLDVLSDWLCSVVDMCELLRSVHPDPYYMLAATEILGDLTNYLNQLNTHRGLFLALRRVVDTPQVLASLDPEERRVAELLLIDFEKSGIHMPENSRKRFVDLYDRILRLGHQFSHMSHPGVDHVRFADPERTLVGVPRILMNRFTAGKEVAEVATTWEDASIVLRYCRVEESRRKMFEGMYSALPDQVLKLEELLKTRAKLAELLGAESYANLILSDQMVKSPASVQSFLESLAAQHRPRALEEIRQLEQLKLILSPGSSPTIHGWDRLFYSQFLAQSHAAPASHPQENITAYLSVGTVFQGLSLLFQSLYGISLQPPPGGQRPGEVWNSEVRRLDVVHEKKGVLGVIYCDLFKREEETEGGKSEAPAHFTIRCSRRLDDDETDPVIVNAKVKGNAHGLSWSGAQPVLSGSGLEVVEDGKRYQMPVVVLVMGLRRPVDGSPTLLTVTEVETIFHEMGHAMHSMLARTQFQHIAGTRVSTDFVEVPSILHEQFYLVVQHAGRSSIGSPHAGGEPHPGAQEKDESHGVRGQNAIETQAQLQMALLDQLYHSPALLESSPEHNSNWLGSLIQSGTSNTTAQPETTFKTTAMLQQLQNRVNVIPYAEGTHWQVQFGHLVGYGATYYSYFWARKWAGRVWRQLFMKPGGGGTDLMRWRDGGELVKDELLKWGGGRDPWIGLERMNVVKEGEREGKGPVSTDLQDLGL